MNPASRVIIKFVSSRGQTHVHIDILSCSRTWLNDIFKCLHISQKHDQRWLQHRMTQHDTCGHNYKPDRENKNGHQQRAPTQAGDHYPCTRLSSPVLFSLHILRVFICFLCRTPSMLSWLVNMRHRVHIWGCLQLQRMLCGRVIPYPLHNR